MNEEECFYRLYLGYQRFGIKYPDTLQGILEIEKISEMYRILKRVKNAIGYELMVNLSLSGIDTSEMTYESIDFVLGKQWMFVIRQDGGRFIKIKTSENSCIFGPTIDEMAKIVASDNFMVIQIHETPFYVALSLDMKMEDEYVGRDENI